MLYKTLSCGEQEYKLRLDAKSAVALESKLGKSIFSVFASIGDDVSQLPPLDVIVALLHASLQKYEHGVTLDGAYEIYDQYMNNGGSYSSMIEDLVGVLEVSGFFKKGNNQQGELKQSKTVNL